MGCCHSTNAEAPPRPPPANPEPTLIRPPPRLARSPRNVSNQQPPWTRAHLRRQREIFFETQTSGDPQVWATLRVVAEHIRRGEMKDAQTIFDAAGLTCPDGSFAKTKHRDPATRRPIAAGGVYDPMGKRYPIPLWCVTDPDDLLENDEQREEGVEKSGPMGASIYSSEDEDADSDDDGPARQSRREYKGKERQGDIGEPLRVRARLTSTTEDVYVSLGSKQSVKVLAEKLSEQLSVSGDRLRLMFKGKELRGDLTLEAQTWTVGDTLSVFVRPENVK